MRPQAAAAEPSPARRVAASTAVQLAGKVAVALLGVASVAVLTRYLGASDYGRFTLALAYIGAFGAIADAGLFSILVREISRSPERTDELVGNALTLRAALWLAVTVLAGAIAFAVGYEPRVRWAILLAAVPFGLGLVNGALVAASQAQLRMGAATAAEVAGRAAALGGAILVAALDLGFYPVLGAVAVGAGATLALTAATARRRMRLRPRADRRVWRRLLTASLPLGLALGLNELYFRADQLIIAAFRPFEEVGLYGLAFRFVEMAATVPGALLMSVFAVLSVYVADGDPRLRQAVQGAFDAFVAAGAPLALGGLVLAPHIVHALAGDEFAGAADALRLLLFAIALSFVNGLFGYALVARDRQRDTLWLNVSALALNLALNLALVPPFGIEAAAASAVVSELAILAGSWWLMRRHLGVWPGAGMVVRAVPAAGIMAGVLWLADGAPLAVLLGLAVAVYAVALALLGGLDRRRLAALRS